MTKRITFNERDALHIYEWKLALNQGQEDIKDCIECRRLEKRLRDFLDKSEVKRVQRLVRKYPYFTRHQKKPKFALDRIAKLMKHTDYGRYLQSISNAKIDFCIRVGTILDQQKKLADNERSQLKADIAWEMEVLLEDFERIRNEYTSPPLREK